MTKRTVLPVTIVAVLAFITILLAVPAMAEEIPGAAGSTTWYLAEGSTAETLYGDYHTYISIMNPNDDDVDLDIQFQTPDGPVNVPTMTQDKETTMNISVEDYVPNNWSVSTRVNASEPVMVDRFMIFQYPGEPPPEPPSYKWAHGSMGVTAPNDQWFLAEGSTGSDYTGSFETWILVQNPTANDTEIDMVFQTPSGEVPGPQAFEVKAGERQTFDVSEYVQNEWSVSTAVTTTDGGQVVCERAMYWSTTVTDRQCAHASVGTTAAGGNWFLAEGSTGITPYSPYVANPEAGNFETWILVQNPSDIDAMIDIGFQTPGGEVLGPQAYTIRAGERQTFDVSQWVADEWSVSTTVTAEPGGGDVIAERAMYWNLPREATSQGDPYQYKRYCAHDSIGAMNYFQTWEAAGMTLPDAGWESWVLVQNPTDQDQEIAITYFVGDCTDPGEVAGPVMTIPAFSRHSFNVNDDLANDVGAIGAVVNVTDPAYPGIVVEHSNYWGYGQGENPQRYRQIAWDSIGHAD